MLILSASDNHNFSVHPESVELDTLLINASEAFKPLAAEKKLSLSVSLPENALPPCTADAECIMQLLSILLHNAISYTPEDRKKIFDRFYRAEKSRSAKGHFGIGLSIASEIVKLHHGTITVSDRVGGGNVFTVTLPLSPW